MGDLSKYFSAWEFDCPHCGATKGPAPELLDVLDRMRHKLGRPLVIVSGYRCPEFNARVGGIPGSEHQWGRAADVPRGLFKAPAARLAGAHGCGLRDGWVVHVDVTPGRRFFTFNDRPPAPTRPSQRR